MYVSRNSRTLAYTLVQKRLPNFFRKLFHKSEPVAVSRMQPVDTINVTLLYITVVNIALCVSSSVLVIVYVMVFNELLFLFWWAKQSQITCLFQLLFPLQFYCQLHISNKMGRFVLLECISIWFKKKNLFLFFIIIFYL